MLLEQLVETLTEQHGEQFDYSELTERFNHYLKYPINLNGTDGKELESLSFLSALQVRNILGHRTLSGPYLSTLELQAVDGIDLNTYRFLSLFVTVQEANPLKEAKWKDYFLEGQHDLMWRYARNIPSARGFHIPDSLGRSRYLGSPDRFFVRYRYGFRNKVYFSLNMEKDAGEQFFAGAQRLGFDFYSASLYLRDFGRWQKIVVGDYGLQFGQGLGMWTGLGFGKGSMLHHMARQEQGLRPYTSTNEFLYLRGLAATYVRGQVRITPFVSYKPVTATLQDTLDGLRYFSSISQTGLHRTPSEAANRNALRQWVLGANTLFSASHFQVGATFYHLGFDGFLDRADRLYNRFGFSGSHSNNASLYYDANVGNAYVFGEGAYQVGRDFAYLNGVLLSLSHQLSAILLHRHYGRAYDVLHNQAVAEASTATNEKGFYSGLSYQPHRQLEWVAYADRFAFPWLRYQVDAPSDGVDLFTQVTYMPNRDTRLLLRYRYRDKAENADGLTVYDLLERVKRQQFRFDVQYRCSDRWRMRNRAEVVLYGKGMEKERGYMLYHDAIYQSARSRFGANCRLAYFNTQGYNPRVYALESDVLYAYSFPLYHNLGLRYYANLRYKMARHMDIWLRYATFVYPQMDSIGSGLDEIAGNRRSEIKIQFRYQH